MSSPSNSDFSAAAAADAAARTNKQMTVLALIIVIMIVVVGTWIIYTIQSIETRQIQRAQISDENAEERDAQHQRQFDKLDQIINLLGNQT